MRTKSEEYNLGVTVHEIGHERISRVKFISKEQWNKRGFQFLLNAIEDPRVNNYMASLFEGPRQWLNEVYNEDKIRNKKNLKEQNKQMQDWFDGKTTCPDFVIKINSEDPTILTQIEIMGGFESEAFKEDMK